VLSAPVIQEPILAARARSRAVLGTGGEHLAALLRRRLPAPLTVIESARSGPDLGSDAIRMAR